MKHRWLAYAWAAPCSLLGLCLALPMWATGASAHRRRGVLEVAWRNQRAAQMLARLPFVAITFGHVVLGRCHAELECLRAHEHAHVRQFERWGALLLLMYPAASLWQWARGRRLYWDNVFEVQARAHEAADASDAALVAGHAAAQSGAPRVHNSPDSSTRTPG